MKEGKRMIARAVVKFFYEEWWEFARNRPFVRRVQREMANGATSAEIQNRAKRGDYDPKIGPLENRLRRWLGYDA